MKRGKSISTIIVKLGVVGVDSGQLMICDPMYLRDQFQNHKDEGESNFFDIYKHTKDGKLWQFCGHDADDAPSRPDINPFTGTFETIIPEYGQTPNQLIKKGLFILTDIDPVPQIKIGEFSGRGIFKTISTSENQGGQLNYKLGHAGVAVAFNSGFGDGEYGVFAELVDTGDFGMRVKKVWVELINDKEIERMTAVVTKNILANQPKCKN